MIDKFSKYLEFLSSSSSLLYIGSGCEYCDSVAVKFKNYFTMDINKDLLDKLRLNLDKNSTNIVIIDANDNNTTLVDEFIDSIREYSDSIEIILLYNKEINNIFNIISKVEISLVYPIDENLLYKKLFAILSIDYTLKAIARREIVLSQNGTSVDMLDEFFDLYEGSSLFISKELMDISKSLNNGELSKILIDSAVVILQEVSDIFTKSEATASIAVVFNELILYLSKLKLEDIPPQNLQAFDYLSNILQDVSIYLLDMFVDRVFKDVYIFEHSLQSNIDFMKNTFDGIDNSSDGDLEFFDD